MEPVTVTVWSKWTIRWLTIRRRLVRIARWRRPLHGIHYHSNVVAYLAINVVVLPVAFQLIRNADKAHKNEGKEETIPDLQPPLDGFEDFHSMQ